MKTVSVKRLSPALGAEVSGITLREPLDRDAFEAISAAWLEHLVLRFRGQRLSDDELLGFTRRFGELDPPGPNPYGAPFLSQYPDINVISNVKIELWRLPVPAGPGLGVLLDEEKVRRYRFEL